MTVNMGPVVRGPLSKLHPITHPQNNDWGPEVLPTKFRGVINPADIDAAKFLPEGTRLDESIEIYAAGWLAFGDVITWHKRFFRVVHCQDYSDYGYHYGVAVLTNEPANPGCGGFVDA